MRRITKLNVPSDAELYLKKLLDMYSNKQAAPNYEFFEILQQNHIIYYNDFWNLIIHFRYYLLLLIDISINYNAKPFWLTKINYQMPKIIIIHIFGPKEEVFKSIFIILYNFVLYNFFLFIFQFN